MNSCVVTVMNEEKTIGMLLEGVLQQTKKIDEVIIVDAGSKDTTIQQIKKYISKNKARNIFIFSKKGNRSMGRNYGIQKSRGNIILVTDAGCIPDKNWAKYLLEGFTKDVDVVSGFYYSDAKEPFAKSLAAYTCVMPDQVNPREYLPSSRSIAFRKNAWEAVGGYPEDLDTCEDLVFAREMKKKGARFYFQKNAFVVWPQKQNVLEAFSQMYGYAKGDGQAMYIREQTPLLFARYLVGIILLLLAIFNQSGWLVVFLFFCFVAYLIWAVVKNGKYVDSDLKYIYLPLLQLTSDIAVLTGMTYGFLKRKH